MNEPSPKWLEKGFVAAKQFLASAGEKEREYRPVSPQAKYYERARELRRDTMAEFHRYDIVNTSMPWILFVRVNPEDGSVLSTDSDIL